MDDRIEDWFSAQEASRPGAIKHRELHGVDWFEVNTPSWVMIAEPFVGVSLEARGGGHDDSGHHHGPADPQAAEIETMLKVLAAIQNDAMPTTPLSLDAGPGIRQRRERISMRFELPDEI